MKALLLLLALTVVTASLVPFIRQEAWWIRVFDFPCSQIFVLGLLTLGGVIWLWDVRSWGGGALVLLLLVALVVQGYRIFPYTTLSTKEVLTAPPASARGAAQESFSLLVSNVLMTNRRADALLEIIRAADPDVVLTLEPDAWWEEQLRPLERTHPYTLKRPLDNAYGMLLHSRLPLVDPTIEYLVKDDIPSMHARLRLPSGHLVWLHGLHPEPPSPTEADESTPRDAELLIMAERIRGRDVPTVVFGDLNDVAWSHTTRLFQRNSGLLDPRKGRGMFNTFHAKIPFLRWPLDHIFHSDHFFVDRIERLPAFGSDHFPVYARLVLAPEAAERQPEPTPDADDREEAQDKIQEAQRSVDP